MLAVDTMYIQHHIAPVDWRQKLGRLCPVLYEVPFVSKLKVFTVHAGIYDALMLVFTIHAGIYDSCWCLHFMLVFTIHAGIYTSYWYLRYQHEV